MLWTILAALFGLSGPAPVATHDSADTADTETTDTGDTAMTTTAYPSTAPVHWATDPGTRATLTTTRQDTGWVPGEPLPALAANAVWGSAADWLGYLSTLAPASGVWGVTDLQILDTLGGAVIGSLSESGGDLLVASSAAGADLDLASVDGAVTITALGTSADVTITPAAGGTVNLTRPAATAADGYQYQTAMTVSRDFGPARRAYWQVGAPLTTTVDSDGGHTMDPVGGTGTYRFRTTLDIPDSGTGGTWTLALTAGDLKVRANNAASAVSVRLISLPTVGVGVSETSVTMWDTAGGTYDYDDNLAPSTASVALTPGNRYSIEIEYDYTSTTHTMGVQALDLHLTKTRVE